MKKNIKIFLIFLFLFIIFSAGKCVQANSIDKISMDIYIDNNGDAHVTEIWDCYVDKGTEVYHPYYNLGNSEIKNLTVKDGNVKYMTDYMNWDTSGTFVSKSYKCGINKISNGVEICWGITNYGSHRYIVNYTITNFVSDLTDSQMIYWTLIPYEFSNSIGQAYVKIYTDFKIANTTDVWGYGNYGGTAYVYDGYIEMQSDGNLSKNEYMTILVKFPKGTFNTTNRLNHNFQYYFDMAEEGTNKYVKSNGANGGMIILIMTLSIFVGAWVLIENVTRTFKFGKAGKRIPRNVPYFRDIPCKKDIFRTYYIGYQYGLIKKKTNLLGALILKWIKEGLIRIAMVGQKEVIIFDKTPEILNDYYEQRLFSILYEASGDGHLEKKELEKWCNRNGDILLSYFDKIIERERYELTKEGLILVEEKKIKKYTATPELKQEAIEIAGLKRYLNEYTLIKDREAIEVYLFEEYLVYAQLFGIAKKVAKQFKDLYPEIIESSKFDSYDNIIFINHCSSGAIAHANIAKNRAEAYSSGGGGFSSGGGGGGSFGGGGGGGGFR